MKIQVKYQCQHLTCRIARCYEGTLTLDKEKFNLYKQNGTEPGCFVSPSNTCKIGYAQQFKIIEMKEEDQTSAQMPKQHEATVEEKKELHNLTLNNGESIQPMQVIVPPPCPNLATVEQVAALEKKIKDLEVRVEKVEGWKKGGKVNRLEHKQ